jgi:DNA-3-methyladenine glycosylase II
MREPYRELAAREPVLARLIDRYGEVDAFGWSDERMESSNFAAMVLHIVGQQISTKVAFVLFDRVAAAVGGKVTPAVVLALGADRLRECGLSRAKAAYLLDLAQRQADGLIDLENMTALEDAEAIAALTAVRGIGLWSAQMFLLAQLHRSDILPAGDMGIRRAVERAWGLPEVPSIKAVEAMGAAWAPYRTYAAALLWRSL